MQTFQTIVMDSVQVVLLKLMAHTFHVFYSLYINKKQTQLIFIIQIEILLFYFLITLVFRSVSIPTSRNILNKDIVSTFHIIKRLLVMICIYGEELSDGVFKEYADVYLM